MFIELIATFVAGLAVAGVVMLANKLTGRRLPRWTTPVAAGLAMIAFTISNEYGWYARTTAALPDGVTVATTVEEQAFYRPWTYVSPYVSRFIAVDSLSVRTNEAAPDRRIVDLLFYGRWASVTRVRAAFDCAAGKRADLVEGVSLGEGGAIDGATWLDTGLDDPVTRTACAGA